MNIRFDVTAEFLDIAEQQIFTIVSAQRLSFNQRWMGNPVIARLKPIVRWLGLALSLIGAVISALPLVFSQPWGSTMMGPQYFLLFFVMIGVFFYYLPWVEQKAISWSRRFTLKSCKKIAARSIKQARKVAPYTAEYDIKGRSISYYREIQGDLEHAWTRKIRGVAIQTEHATILFRKWKSFVPQVVVLHPDSGLVKAALTEQNIECVKYNDSILEKQNSSTT